MCFCLFLRMLTVSIRGPLRTSSSGRRRCQGGSGSSSWERWAGGRAKASDGTARVPWNPSSSTSKLTAKVRETENLVMHILDLDCLDELCSQKIVRSVLKWVINATGSGNTDNDCNVLGLVAEGEKLQKQTGGLVVTKDLMGKIHLHIFLQKWQPCWPLVLHFQASSQTDFSALHEVLAC